MQNDGTYDIIKSDYKYNDISNLNRFIAYKNPFRYRSYYYDFETNLYYLNSRYYDPQLGRFVNADDISTLDVSKITLNGLNLYAYCLNNPVNEIDENGYILGWLIGLIVAMAIGAVVSAVVYSAAVVVRGIFEGVWEWDWTEFLKSVIGGLIGGLISYMPFFGPVLSAFLTGFTTSIIDDAIDSGINGTKFNLKDSVFKGFLNGILSVGAYAVMNLYYPVKGITFGRGSWNAVSNQIFKKFWRGMITGISLKTAGKIIGLQFYMSFVDIFNEAFGVGG